MKDDGADADVKSQIMKALQPCQWNRTIVDKVESKGKTWSEGANHSHKIDFTGVILLVLYAPPRSRTR